MSKKFTYVDLFCGAGGFTAGFERAGLKNVFSIDFDKNFCKTYKRNFPEHHLIEKDITLLTTKEIRNILGNTKVDIVIGGPPCQGFSIAGNIGRKFLDDDRNKLFNEFVRVVKIVRPAVFVMENVARLFSHNNNRTRRDILKSFYEIGYKTECKVVNAADYGIPQVRRRVLFIGTRNKKLQITFPEASVSHKVTVSDALEDMPALNSGESSDAFFNHKAMRHSDQMITKMNFVLDGGDRLQIPASIRPRTGDARKYIRYDSNAPSVTVTGDMRKIFHFSQNRALTVRELARLQSFSDDFIFEGTSISQQQQVGNAVPPLMAETIARHLIKNLL